MSSVQGPAGTIPVTFVSVNLNTNGSPRTATYQFTPPGGSWDLTDAGLYSVILQSDQVGDTAGNFAANATIGTFNVRLPRPSSPPRSTTAQFSGSP